MCAVELLYELQSLFSLNMAGMAYDWQCFEGVRCSMWMLVHVLATVHMPVIQWCSFGNIAEGYYTPRTSTTITTKWSNKQVHAKHEDAPIDIILFDEYCSWFALTYLNMGTTMELLYCIKALVSPLRFFFFFFFLLIQIKVKCIRSIWVQRWSCNMMFRVMVELTVAGVILLRCWKFQLVFFVFF